MGKDRQGVGREEMEEDSTEIGRQRSKTTHWSRPD